MRYKQLAFDGNIGHWFSTILQGDEHMLLNPPNDFTTVDPPNNNDRQIGLFTSASTGRAKCIWNSINHLKENARITAREFNISSDDRLLMMAKPWHVAGLSWVLLAESVGADYSFILTKSGEAQRWHDAIKEYKPTCLLTVPAVLRSLFTYSDWFVPCIVFGGAPVSNEDYEPLSEHASRICQGYGQTEAGGLISCQTMDMESDIPDHACYCYGYPPDEFSIECEGSQKDPGAIWLDSPTSIYSGYYDTGDRGYLSKDGMLYLVGRKSY